MLVATPLSAAQKPSHAPKAVIVDAIPTSSCQGKEASLDASGRYPVGTTTRYLGNFPNSLTVITVVRQAESWKVDMGWWEALAMLTDEGPPPGSPAYAVKMLTAALVTPHRDEEW
jgi:hypothetical protein